MTSTETSQQNQAEHGGSSTSSESTTTTDAGTNNNTGSEQGRETTTESDKRFTQAELDQKIAHRVASERRKVEKEAEGDREKLRQLEEATQSESEKALSAARKEGADAVMAKANSRLVASEARALAAEAGFRSPQLAVKAVDLGGVKVTDDGVDADAIRAALQTLAEEEPYLVKGKDEPAKQTSLVPDPTQGSGRPTAPSGDRGRAEAERRFGKPQQ